MIKITSYDSYAKEKEMQYSNSYYKCQVNTIDFPEFYVTYIYKFNGLDFSSRVLWSL